MLRLRDCLVFLRNPANEQARDVPTHEVAARIGEQHVEPFMDARQAVGAAAKLLANDAHFMAQCESPFWTISKLDQCDSERRRCV